MHKAYDAYAVLGFISSLFIPFFPSSDEEQVANTCFILMYPSTVKAKG